jgi:hypothetical protein
VGEVSTILLIPAPEHREALLSDGSGGSRAPMMWWSSVGNRWLPFDGVTREALVLALDGDVVWDGVFRAWKQADEAGDALMEALFEGIESLPEVVAGWTRDGGPAALGTIVFLDKDGREVKGGN